MTVCLVGTGPAVAALDAAVADLDVERTPGLDAMDEADLTAIVGPAGDPVFERANKRALATDSRWLVIELGGVGGVPVWDCAITAFAPGRGCYDCLRGRVRANLDDEGTEVPAAENTPGGGVGAVPVRTRRFAGAVAGHRATAFLADGDDIFGRVVLTPYEERPYLPLPHCTCASTRDRTLSRGDADRSVEDALARAEQALDDRFGPVQEVGEAESVPVPYYLARTCETSGFSDASAPRDAAGVDPDWNGAFMKALGEALERYCAGVYRTASFETGPPATIEAAVSPVQFVCETDPAGETVHWVPGTDLSTDEAVQLPAEFVQYPPPEQRYRPAVTTGLGFGNSWTQALLAGLYEVVERDAAMLAWHSTFDPLGLALDDGDFQALVDRARVADLSVTPILLTVDVDVPVVAVAVHREEWPRFAIGTDADLSVAGAARSALAEALQNWMELDGMGPDGAAEALGAIGRYAETPGEAMAFVDTETTVPAETVGPDPDPTGKEELDAVVSAVADAGMTAYGASTTTRDVDHLGFEAVRVVVPSAQPLCFGDPYFGERARAVPDALGFEPRLDRDHHPFP